jgi:pyruvate/2-oxoglutarate dehydrogenase complex dihydrolipoamide acyltransferase (E2) component
VTDRQTEALEKLNQGIQESRREVQQRTMNLAQDYFGGSAEALKQQINEGRSTLEGLPDQIPGGREEVFQTLFQELMDNYSHMEECIDEARQNVANLDTDQIRRQGEVDATDAARREARERGVDLTKIEGTGSDGRIIVSDVVEAAEAMEAEASEDGAASQAAQQAQDAAGQAAGQAQQVADQATDQAGQVAGQAQDAAGQAAGQVQDTVGGLTGGLTGGQQQGGPLGGVTDQVGQVAQGVQDTAGQATDQAGQVAGQAQDAAGGAAQQAQDTAGQAVGQAQQAAGGDGSEEPRATNAARRRAEQLGIDLSTIQGSGSGGLITIRDVTGS